MAKATLFFLFSLSLLALVSADCKSFVKDGFPVGIKPLSPNLTVVQSTADAVNTSFKVYIEGDAMGGNLAGCIVKLSIIDAKGEGARLYVTPPSLETGLGWKDAEAMLVSQPAEPFGDVNATIRIEDIDNSNNYALLPVYIKTTYRPQPSATVRPTATSAPATAPAVSPPAEIPPLRPVDAITQIGKELEEDASKYTIAVLAVFFLGALLWVGLKTLQKD